MKKIAAAIFAIVLAAALTACNEVETPSHEVSRNQGSAQNTSSSEESTSSESSTSSEEPYVPLTVRDYDLKGEDLIAKFK